MTLDVLLKSLGTCPISVMTIQHPRQQIRFLAPLDRAVCALPGTVLYHGTYSRLAEMPTCPESAGALLLWLDAPDPDPTVWASWTNVFATADGGGYAACLDTLGEGLLEDARLEQGNRDLLDRIAADRPLSELADEIGRLYRHYVDILDTSLNILALSENIAPPSPRLLEDNRTRLVQPNVVQYLRLSGSLRQMQSSREPVLVEDEPREVYAYSAPVLVGTALPVGYLCIFTRKGETFSPLMLYHISETAKLLGLKLQQVLQEHTSKATYFTHLLTGMLQGVPATVSSYEERFLAFNYRMKRLKRVLALRLMPEMPAQMDIHLLSSTLQELIVNSVYVVHENFVVFLSTADRLADFQKSDIMVEEYLKANRLRMAVSGTFEQESALRDHFAQAKSAFRLGERFCPDSCLYAYDAVRMLDIVDSLSEVRNLSLLCYPPLRLLQEVDRADGRNSLLRTLYCYLQNGQSVARTCETLYIHRNTLYYRLQKIQDIMGCDLADMDTMTQISFSFVILRYLNQLDV